MSHSDLHEKCAVFGVYGEGLDASRLTFYGLFALQHRGQESSGITASDGTKMIRHADMGLVSTVYTEDHIKRLPGHLAIGHNRYSTAGGSRIEHVQPVLVDRLPSDVGGTIALAHNGNLPSTVSLEAELRKHDIDFYGFSDSRMVAEMIGSFIRKGSSLIDAVKQTYPLMTGAFSILIMSKDTIIAIRDAYGVRPLSLAKLNGGYVVSSETCAFHPVGAEFLRDVEPGEMVVIDASGVRSEQLAKPNLKLDIFEFVYFARHDSQLLGKSVYEVRVNFGTQLAKEYAFDADVVIPVPETAIPVALGFSRAAGIPLEFGLAKNRYIHRTFIQPEQHIRDQGVKAKLSPIPETIRGKRVIIVDDSIVRGTTSKKIVQMLFEAGAKEVHFLVSSPPVKYPDFYGIDTPKQKDLIASHMSVEEMRQYLGATSLSFLSYGGMIAATGLPRDSFCTSCFDGVYPIDLKERANEVVKLQDASCTIAGSGVRMLG